MSYFSYFPKSIDNYFSRGIQNISISIKTQKLCSRVSLNYGDHSFFDKKSQFMEKF